MSKRNMTEIEVDGFKYTASIAARKHVYEVLAPYESSKDEMTQPTWPPEVTAPAQAPPRTISGKSEQKRGIFEKKGKKKK